MKAKVKVTLKTGVLDPQGKAIEHTLSSLGFAGVNACRQGKYIELELARPTRPQPAAVRPCARSCSPTRSSKTTTSN